MAVSKLDKLIERAERAAVTGMPYTERRAMCKNHGSYVLNPLDGDQREFFLADCPKCLAERRREQRLQASGIPPRFQDRTIHNYATPTVAQVSAYKTAFDYAENFATYLRDGACLLLVGSPGTGKTHLACGIAHKIMADGYSAQFVTVSEAIRKFRASWRRDSEQSEDEVLKLYSKPDLLILDEVGVQYGTEAEQLIIFEIINRRYFDQRPMIVISNLSIVGQEDDKHSVRGYLGERALDRLRENGGRVVVFDWESYRRRPVGLRFDVSQPEAIHAN